jgi:ribosomal protein S27AE
MPQSYTDEETRTLLHDFLEGRSLLCPRCGVPMDARPVHPRRDVSYVRDRLWLVCPRCRRTAVLDRREHP